MCSSRQLASLLSAYDSTHKAYVPDDVKKARARLKKQVYNRERFRLKRCHHQAELQMLSSEIQSLERHARELAYFKRSSLSWMDIAAVFKTERQLSEHQNRDLKAQIEEHKEKCRVLLACAKINLGDGERLPDELMDIDAAVVDGNDPTAIASSPPTTPASVDPLDSMLDNMEDLLQEPFYASSPIPSSTSVVC
ncbi:hypothetical protein, variant [Saprolegnia diclina VS20]|uniref:BZIP domain-containing protein n=1 Tax=Saprolegnia diclina (strain VS20) TaxID=1156394 RepID=T0SCP0_SAPDV|nr:hypothetical protein SDRG_01701 [Saprolegnia diclina VS20]XP_008605462.1 hypothetical protein, variant [Saprolegnia diclina VS20]EQC40617.1 hypothetical protein SDRG_01701 [Saprolegnia diclina VS20]EQC40618.1 hypothetical protein, variant [Saprolegnia diclina VS20]|eukprot:XP_008605461.1 hypothetical protein SDRG_01701 [Saprolegnia diclina VS20]